MKLISEFYVKGVIHGDGWIQTSNTNPRIFLAVKSNFFAKLFASHLIQMGLTPRWGKRTFDLSKNPNPKFHYDKKVNLVTVNATIRKDKLFTILNSNPITKNEKISYIKGFFMSDGCYCNYKKHYFYISFTNKNKKILKKINKYLIDVGVFPTSVVTKKDGLSVLLIYKQLQIEKFRNLIGVEK